MRKIIFLQDFEFNSGKIKCFQGVEYSIITEECNYYIVHPDSPIDKSYVIQLNKDSENVLFQVV